MTVEWNDKGEVVDNPLAGMTREEMFDRAYWCGGSKVGGYANEGYRDFPCHEITAKHILARKPESVLELGASRGYVLKRIQDAGIVVAYGLEISKHCYMTRACDGIIQRDLCNTPWPVVCPDNDPEGMYDLCYSIATFEHIPEEHIPAVLVEIKRTCKRGLHGIDFGDNDNGWDKTHCSLHDRAWWVRKFSEAGLENHEIVNKEELEKGGFPADVLNGDGKIKLNVGCGLQMHHHGWVNIDVHDLAKFAEQNLYKYLRHDVRTGLPFQTGSVSLINACHFLQDLTYREGIEFLRECRRVLKPDGAMRLSVPSASDLVDCYYNGFGSDRSRNDALSQYDEINADCSNASSDAEKFWHLLIAGHNSIYDWNNLWTALDNTGFKSECVDFRSTSKEPVKQILKETIDGIPQISLYADAVPKLA